MARLFRTDFHVHTNLSDCGAPEATPKAILAAARQVGLEALGFSDHVTGRAHWDRPARVRAQVPKRLGEMRIYIGCEADVLSLDRLSLDAGLAATLDYVLMSASHLYEPYAFHPVEGMEAPTMAAYILEAMHAALDSGLVDILVHPFHVPSGLYKFPQLVEAADPEGISRVGEKAARLGVAIEYNPRELGLYPEAARWLYGRFLETGVKLAINSDSHHPREIGFHARRQASEEAMLAEGITEEHLWRIEDRVSVGRRGQPV